MVFIYQGICCLYTYEIYIYEKTIGGIWCLYTKVYVVYIPINEKTISGICCLYTKIYVVVYVVYIPRLVSYMTLFIYIINLD